MFQYGLSDMLNQILALPPHLLGWLLWLTAITLFAPLFFMRHRETRVMLGWQLANIIFGTALFSMFGLVRLLSLSHLLFWTPAAIYLYRNRPQDWQSPFGIWLYAALVTMSISLVLDEIELLRYLFGARGLISG